MRDTTAGRVTATLTIVGAIGFLFFWFHPFPPRPNARVHEALGQILADETLRLAGPSGRLTLIRRETSEFETPATEIQLRGFLKALEKARRKVAATKLVKIDPLRVVSVPPGDFFELLRKGAEPDVVVSLMGPADLNEGQIAQLAGRRPPRVVALCTGSTPAQIDLKRLFANDLLHAAVISKKDAEVTPVQPASPRGWFDRFYQLITPENLADLPQSPGTRR